MMSYAQFKNNSLQSGSHWFSEGAMRFFKTNVVYWENETGYFITSEINPSDEKRYTIRKADFDTYKVDTIGEFHSHKTLQSAKRWLAGYKVGAHQ